MIIEADLPEGTTFTKTTVRDALRDAMAEEMRLDDNVFIMGEEVAEYEGAYKVTQGLHKEFGDRRVYRYPRSRNMVFGRLRGSGRPWRA